MTPDDLKAIRERAEKANRFLPEPGATHASVQDVPALLAEVERLRTEKDATLTRLEKLKTAIAWVPGVGPGPAAALVAEVDRVANDIRTEAPLRPMSEVISDALGGRPR